MKQFSFFISKRISASGNEGESFTSTISKVAVASIAIGLIVMLLSILILAGFKDTIRNKIYSFTGHFVVSKYTLRNSLDDHIDLKNDLFLLKDSLSFIDHIEPYGMKAGLLKTKSDIQGVFLKGVDEHFSESGFGENLVQGGMPKLTGKSENYSNEILVSSYLSKLLKLTVGNDVIIYFADNPPRYRKLSITGIYETGLEDFDTKTIVGDLGMIRRLNGWSNTKASGMQVFVKTTDDLDGQYDDLFDIIGYNFFLSAVSDRYIQVFDWLNLLDRNVIVLLTIVLLIAMINMISILLILIMERTRMIGVLMALGASKGQIRMIFAYQGMLLTAKGMLLGNVIGLGLCAVQYYFQVIPLDQDSYYMSFVPVSWPVESILLVNLGTFLIISLTMMIPTISISNIKPVEAIRFD